MLAILTIFAFFSGLTCFAAENELLHIPPIRSLESYAYDEQYHNIALRTNQDTAVIVVAFNRPDYLARTIASLEKNPESQKLPFYFFLDGGTRARQEDNCAVINNSKLPFKHIIKRDCNYGCPRNHIDSKRFIFDWCGFEKVVIIEEDLEVTPSFIHINLALHDWATKKFSNVGAVQCWSYCYLKPTQKEPKLVEVTNKEKFWWSFVGYCLGKTVWDEIKSFLYQFEAFVQELPQDPTYDAPRSKPAKDPVLATRIKSWVKNDMLPQRQAYRTTADKDFFDANTLEFLARRLSTHDYDPCQDAMTGIALWLNGFVKIQTTVNRAAHIGAEGITCTADTYKKRFETITLDYFEHDHAITDFVVNLRVKSDSE